jgi:3-dehydroquinate dehydratase-2
MRDENGNLETGAWLLQRVSKTVAMVERGETANPPAGQSLRILVISGPNLNLLGRREPGMYGAVTLQDIHARLERRAQELRCAVEPFQSNHEGALIDFLHAHIDDAGGAILNPGGLTHTSVALHDAVKAMPFPVIEVHLSNVHAREEFRRRSLIAPATRGQIIGLGWYGYLAALEALVTLTRDERP